MNNGTESITLSTNSYMLVVKFRKESVQLGMYLHNAERIFSGHKYASIEPIVTVSDWFAPRMNRGFSATSVQRSVCAWIKHGDHSSISYLQLKRRIILPAG
jgi:hypothetical protein